MASSQLVPRNQGQRDAAEDDAIVYGHSHYSALELPKQHAMAPSSTKVAPDLVSALTSQCTPGCMLVGLAGLAACSLGGLPLLARAAKAEVAVPPQQASPRKEELDPKNGATEHPPKATQGKDKSAAKKHHTDKTKKQRMEKGKDVATGGAGLLQTETRKGKISIGTNIGDGREMIQIGMGQCGVNCTLALYEGMLKEHGLSSDGSFGGSKYKEGHVPACLQRLTTYFRPTNSRYEEAKWVPRSVLVDLEPGTMDVIKASPNGDLFNHDNMVFGSSGAGNNWAKGHYTEGAELIEEVLDVLRKEIEETDSPQGFELCHSIGGGTGAGMGSLLLQKLRDHYPDQFLQTWSVFPSPKVSDTVVEPYNAVLTCHQLLEYSDMTFPIDNEALFNISHNVLQQTAPTYVDLNHLIKTCYLDATACLRFPNQYSTNARKMAIDLVPFPRLKFMLLACAPLSSKDNQAHQLVNVQELTNQCFSPRNLFSNVKPDDGKYLAASLNYRGGMSLREVDEQMEKRQSRDSKDFVNWIPDQVKTDVIGVASKTAPQSASLIANSTATKGMFQRIATQFAKMYKRKAFLHWYKGEGMDEMEFQLADKDVRDLITEYTDKQDATYASADGAGHDDDDEW